jgi:hypothetical protein
MTFPRMVTDESRGGQVSQTFHVSGVNKLIPASAGVEVLIAATETTVG